MGGAKLAPSQVLIVNVYTLIAMVYCAASSLLYYTVAGLPFLGFVHLSSLCVIGINFLVLQWSRRYDVATHVILAVGTWVVGSLFGTGGWEGTGWLWTFAYLPYAFFLATTAVATLWVVVLLAVDAVLLAMQRSGAIPTPYTPLELGMFAASLGVFLLCMFLFKRANLQSERLADRRATELAEANAHLKSSEADLAQAQRTAGLGSWTWDPATGATTWSAQLRAMFGFDGEPVPQGVLGVRPFVHPDDRGQLDAIERAARDGLPVDAELRIVRRDGAVRSLQVRGRSERSEAGAVQRTVGTAQDVTEQRAAEEARRTAAVQMQELESLKAINRLKTQFMNTAAHELSTPLTPIALELRVLKDAEADATPERRRKALAVLERNLDRLRLLVRDLLEGARLQSGQLALQRRPVDLQALVAETTRALATTAQVAGVGVVVAPGPGPLWVDGDPKRLAQVLDNLVGNAIKFTPPGGTVTVRGHRASGGVFVRVEDTGVGLRKEDITKLFQPFSQVHPTMDRTRSGSGLGLYICKGIVEAHAGRVGVESGGPGKGSSFWFVLPVGEGPSAQDAAPGPMPV